MNEPSAAELRRALVVARAVVAHHVSGPAARMERLLGGLTNLVFAARHPEGDFIVRLSTEPDKLAVFRREEAVMSRARAAGVPSPMILAIGNDIDSYTYMLQRRVRGRDATRHRERRMILREMARYAAIINAIPTVGFGKSFAWNDASETAPATPHPKGKDFDAFLDEELELETRLSFLERHGMLTRGALERVRSTLRTVARTGRTPALVHGDLRLKNVLVDHRGEITAIIDWEDSASSLAPEWEWSVALHDLSTDEKQDFLSGYGATAEAIAEHMVVAKALNVVNYVPAIEQQLANGDSEALERTRVRLRGLLDLYSL